LSFISLNRTTILFLQEVKQGAIMISGKKAKSFKNQNKNQKNV